MSARGAGVTFEEANEMIVGEVQSIMTLDERRCVFDSVREVRHLGPIVEVGSAYGGTTIIMAMAAHGEADVYSCDNWQCGQQDVFLRNVAGAGLCTAIKMIVGNSYDLADRFSDDECAVVLVDAEHEGFAPYLDLMAWAPKVKVGGYLMVDDCDNGHPDVVSALEAWGDSDSSERFAPVASIPDDAGLIKLRTWRRVK